MLIAMRKHTKAIFWIILILIIPAFVVLYLPRQFRRPGRSLRYGSMFGKTVKLKDFGRARDAELRALSDFFRALGTMDYRKPQYDFLRVRRDLALMSFAAYEERLRQREAMLALYTGRAPRPVDLVPLERARELLKQGFTDRETNEYNEAAYRERLRKVGMTDEEYVAEYRDNLSVFDQVLPVLRGEGERGWDLQRLATWQRLVLAHEADRLGIPVSDEEVVNYLYLICPGEDGTIDEERYAARLRWAGQPRAAYEREIRATIRIAKLQWMILGSVKAPEQDVTDRFTKRYTTFKLAYHLEPYEPLMEPEALRDDEVLAFYVKNRGDPFYADGFRIAPRVAVMYVLVEAKAFDSKVEVPDDELRAYYETHRDAFADADGVPLPYEMCAKAVRAAVVEAHYPREAEKLARAEASRLFSVSSPVRLIQEAAKRGYEVQHTPLFGEEGEIDGLIGEDEELFRDTALGLEAGEVSRLVAVKQGWCVLSPTQVVPDASARQRPRDEVLRVARIEAARDRASKLAREVAIGLFEQVKELMDEEGIGFLEACGRLGLEVTETGFLGRDDEELPGLENGRDLIGRASMGERVDELIAEGLVNTRDAYVRDLVDEGTVFFSVLETRAPDASVQAKKGPGFAGEVVLRSLQSEAYGEWLQALVAKAAIVDEQEEQRQAEQERLRTQEGRLTQ